MAALAASHVPSEWRECTQTLVHRQQMQSRENVASLPKSTHNASNWISIRRTFAPHTRAYIAWIRESLDPARWCAEPAFNHCLTAPIV